jgi:uncharacterized protein YegL
MGVVTFEYHARTETEIETMKNLLLAAVAAFGLVAAIVPAAHAQSTVAGDQQATRMQQTGTLR